MGKTLQAEASEALAGLIQAAHTCKSDYVGKGIERAKQVIENPNATADQKLDEAMGVGGGLSRGEWDRLFVDSGGLPYLSIFEAPIAIYRYCETLPLDSTRLAFVRGQIVKLQRALEFHRARIEAEQVSGGNGGQSL